MADSTKTLLVTDKFRVEEVWHSDESGGVMRKAVVRHPGAVAVIPMVDHQRVCLIRNRRLSVGTTLIEIPAGTLDPGEHPEETARRELTEETGFRAERFSLLCRFFTSPGILDEEMHVFLAEQLTPGPTNFDAGEQIENLIVPWDDALAMVFDGKIRDSKTIASLLYYAHLKRSG